MKTFMLGTTATLALLMTAHAASAQDYFWNEDGESVSARSPWMWRIRGVAFNPNESSDVSGGGKIGVDQALAPEVDATYFFDNSKIALEMALTGGNHDVLAQNTGSGDLDLGEVSTLLPMVHLQYHFMPRTELFRPYVGIGFAYMWMYDSQITSDITAASYEDSFGYSIQAGVDYTLNDTWALNADIKQLFINGDVDINNGAITADVDYNPTVVGVGMAYKW